MKLFVKFRRGQRRFRGYLLTAWIRMCGGSVGPRLEVERGVVLRWLPHQGLTLGEHVYLGVGVIIDVAKPARLHIGSDAKIMHYSVIAASSKVSIGRATQVAEHCSVRDSDHGMDLTKPMRDQSVSTPTIIGDDVWVGRGSAVLRGSDVGDGAVIGANSLVRGPIPSLAIAVGSPVHIVRFRGAAEV